MSLRIPPLVRERLQAIADQLKAAEQKGTEALVRNRTALGAAGQRLDTNAWMVGWLGAATEGAVEELESLLSMTAPRQRQKDGAR